MASLAVLCPGLQAQTAAPRTAEQRQALIAQHRGDFDYLLGDWSFTSVSREFGNGRGFWSAVRLADGDLILDEWRVVGDSGETWYVTNTLRAYNAFLDQWELVGTDEGTGLQHMGTARRVHQEMLLTQRFGVGGPNPSLWRIRYFNIRPDRFSWAADRSLDEGRSWTPNHLTIEARRIGPPRSLPPLAPARRP